MAIIESYEFRKEGIITPTVLGVSDTATVNLNKSTTLIVTNDTGATLSINVTGDTATYVDCDGIGEIDVSGGVTFDVLDGETYKLPLNTQYQKWLGDGNITVTGGDLATAYILDI